MGLITSFPLNSTTLIITMEKPKCKLCKIEMEIHKTMKGDVYQCDNYSQCGQMCKIGKTDNTNKASEVENV